MCGRNFEYLGEDPYLAGKIAAMFIRGMQNEGVMATAKHYMANYQEYDRHNISSDMDERTMREIYLPAFEASVTEGHVAAIMTSYNLVNGIHASQHGYLINGILKDEWKFDGLVMSDWTSTYDAVAAANAGLDLEMPYGKFMCRDSLLPAIRDGRVAEKTIDEKVRRILGQYARFGYFEYPDLSKGFVLDSALVRKIAIDDARGGIVLLKNHGRVLPINLSKIKTIAVIGPNGHPAVTGGGGSSYVQPLHSLSFYEALRQVAGPDVRITYESGMYGDELLPDEFYNNADFYYYADGKKYPGMKCNYYSGWPEGTPNYQQIVRRLNLVFKDSIPGISRGRFSARFSGYMMVNHSGKYNFVASSDASFRVFVDDKQIMGVWRGTKEAVHSAVVSLEAGKEHSIAVHYMQRGEHGVIRLGYEAPSAYEQKSAAILQRARQLASQSDLTIVCVGFNNGSETEGADRSFKLPDEQEKLVGEVSKANKDFIVVLNAGGNVDMRAWLGKAKGLVHAWYPGGEGNIAVAEILLGKTNPSGRLPVSFEKRWEDNATYKSYYDDDGDKHVRFTEGILLGYRHFDKDNINPQFPFGYGLSYTTFGYSNLSVNRAKLRPSGELTVTITVKNTGKVDGAEVVQLYVNQAKSSVPRPVKELKAFSKVWLKAGESKRVGLTLRSDAFRYFSPEKMKWVVEPGTYNILIGSSSRQIRLRTAVWVVK
jgi:beta-glucosidase